MWDKKNARKNQTLTGLTYLKPDFACEIKSILPIDPNYKVQTRSE